jgi:hypothetical protein
LLVLVLTVFCSGVFGASNSSDARNVSRGNCVDEDGSVVDSQGRVGFEVNKGGVVSWTALSTDNRRSLICKDRCLDAKRLSECFCNPLGIIQQSVVTCANGCGAVRCLNQGESENETFKAGCSEKVSSASINESSVGYVNIFDAMGKGIRYYDFCYNSTALTKHSCGSNLLSGYRTELVYCNCRDDVCVDFVKSSPWTTSLAAFFTGLILAVTGAFLIRYGIKRY